MSVKKRIDDLRKEIKKHNDLYYSKGKPSISDGAYDALIRELKKLEKENPEYASTDSPTATVGSPIQRGFQKIKHLAPMLSLESINTVEECEKFDRTAKKDLGVEKMDYMCEPKLDGLSIELVYEKGVFVSGSTRGDGTFGEDVTENLRLIKNIPGKLSGKKVPDKISVRGEVLMLIKDFQALNKKQAESGKDIFANPRNAAAGSMRQLDLSIAGERKLYAYCYDILYTSGEMPKTHADTIKYLDELGITTTPGHEHASSIEEAIKYHKDSGNKRDDLDYEIDGVVIKINDYEYRRQLGMRTTNPRWAVAYKFEPRKEITKVENIVVQVGRTGIMTPVALLMPVEVGGVTVSRANLHNMDEIARLGVKIGDHVKVQRAGDVIPDVVEVITSKRNGEEKDFHMPRVCPSCGTKLEKEDVFYRCPAGLGCTAQVKEAIVHYASKGAVDINGFSDMTVDQFYEEGLIKSISDVYTLKREDILKLEGWKEKKTDNLLAAIEKSKIVTLDCFIYGLGIRNVGKHIAALFADKFAILDKFMGATKEELTAIHEIGPETADSVIALFANKKNTDEIKKLLSCGVTIKEKAASGKFAGMKIVFTGSLPSIGRSDAQKIVEKEGGEAQSSVSDSTTFVVAGENAGSKLDAARKKGIKIISEDDFLKMLGNPKMPESLF
ncbi:MAG TPA: NAD-dependent DNA ligase LigA [Candidatus Omnitrophota bacterium]|nr:NAD-dependent DNA ligase LigA [Candidatus Omnitrophota bacterium]